MTSLANDFESYKSEINSHKTKKLKISLPEKNLNFTAKKLAKKIFKIRIKIKGESKFFDWR